MIYRFPAPAALMVAAIALSGCASESLLGNGGFTTSALTPPPADPACVNLASQIEGLRKDGVAEKIEKAAAKKYKMTPADLTKADQLTKANADFQSKCSTVPPKPASQVSSASASGASSPPASVTAASASTPKSASPAPKSTSVSAAPAPK